MALCLESSIFAKKKKCFSSKNIFFVLTQNYKCWTVEHHLKRLQNNFFEKSFLKKLNGKFAKITFAFCHFLKLLALTEMYSLSVRLSPVYIGVVWWGNTHNNHKSLLVASNQRCRSATTFSVMTLSIMRLCHPPDGSPSPKYNL